MGYVTFHTEGTSLQLSSFPVFIRGCVIPPTFFKNLKLRIFYCHNSKNPVVQLDLNNGPEQKVLQSECSSFEFCLTLFFHLFFLYAFVLFLIILCVLLLLSFHLSFFLSIFLSDLFVFKLGTP